MRVRTYIYTHVRRDICTYVRELASACERSLERARGELEPRGTAGRRDGGTAGTDGGGPGRGWGRGRGRGGRTAVEALEEEVRGQPYSRRGRRDAHRATPTRGSFLARLSSSSTCSSSPRSSGRSCTFHARSAPSVAHREMPHRFPSDSRAYLPATRAVRYTYRYHVAVIVSTVIFRRGFALSRFRLVQRSYVCSHYG